MTKRVREATDEWEIRTLDNLRRARKLDDRGLLPAAMEFVHARLGSRIDAYQEYIKSTGSLFPEAAPVVDFAMRYMGSAVTWCSFPSQLRSSLLTSRPRWRWCSRDDRRVHSGLSLRTAPSSTS